jgi:hypothetical protein
MHSLFEVLNGRRTTVEARIASKLSNLDLTTVQSMLAVDVEGASAGSRSHTLVVNVCTQQPRPTDEGYLHSDAVSRTLAGAFVYKVILSRYGAEFHQHMVSLGRTPLMDDTMAVDENRLGELVDQSPPRSKCIYSRCDHVLRTYQGARGVCV